MYICSSIDLSLFCSQSLWIIILIKMLQLNLIFFNFMQHCLAVYEKRHNIESGAFTVIHSEQNVSVFTSSETVATPMTSPGQLGRASLRPGRWRRGRPRRRCNLTHRTHRVGNWRAANGWVTMATRVVQFCRPAAKIRLKTQLLLIRRGLVFCSQWYCHYLSAAVHRGRLHAPIICIISLIERGSDV